MRPLFGQAIFLPLYFFVPLLIAGSLVDGYSLVSQQGSEITLTDNTVAKLILSAGAITAGASCILLAAGMLFRRRRDVALSGFFVAVFGVSMISNGIYPMGSPMHGLYGVGLSLAIAPFASMYEWKGTSMPARYFSLSIVAGFMIAIYYWSIIVGFDPPDYRGLTQRLASVFIFGWIAYSAWEMRRLGGEFAAEAAAV